MVVLNSFILFYIFEQTRQEYNNSLNELRNFNRWTLVSRKWSFSLKISQNYFILSCRYHIFDRFKIPTITASEQPHMTLSQSVFVNAKPVESCLENVSDWLSSSFTSEGRIIDVET